jgi:hypothetical protein
MDVFGILINACVFFQDDLIELSIVRGISWKKRFFPGASIETTILHLGDNSGLKTSALKNKVLSMYVNRVEGFVRNVSPYSFFANTIPEN